MSEAGQDPIVSTRRGNDAAGPGLVTLLVIQIIVGYEWLASGITKVASGYLMLKGRRRGDRGPAAGAPDPRAES